jgi:hypothetical protein
MAVTCASLILVSATRFAPPENVGHRVTVEAPDQFSGLLIDFTQHP